MQLRLIIDYLIIINLSKRTMRFKMPAFLLDFICKNIY